MPSSSCFTVLAYLFIGRHAWHQRQGTSGLIRTNRRRRLTAMERSRLKTKTCAVSASGRNLAREVACKCIFCVAFNFPQSGIPCVAIPRHPLHQRRDTTWVDQTGHEQLESEVYFINPFAMLHSFSVCIRAHGYLIQPRFMLCSLVVSA